MSYNLIKLNTARNALRYVINAFNIKEIYLPYYICPAIRTAVNKENCKIVFYHIDKDFNPMRDFPIDAFVLYINYFGVCFDIVEKLSLKYKNLIVDNAHSFFSAPKGIASFNSLRKFFPILRDGSFLYTERTINESFEIDDFEYTPHLPDYKELCLNEKRLDEAEIKYISPVTEKFFNSIDLEKEKRMRIEQFYYWQERLNGNVNIKKDEAPFAYPYLAKTSQLADKLVKQLEKENISIYRYWNNFPDSFPEKVLYTNLAAVPL